MKFTKHRRRIHYLIWLLLGTKEKKFTKYRISLYMVNCTPFPLFLHFYTIHGQHVMMCYIIKAQWAQHRRPNQKHEHNSGFDVLGL